MCFLWRGSGRKDHYGLALLFACFLLCRVYQFARRAVGGTLDGDDRPSLCGGVPIACYMCGVMPQWCSMLFSPSVNALTCFLFCGWEKESDRSVPETVWCCHDPDSRFCARAHGFSNCTDLGDKTGGMPHTQSQAVGRAAGWGVAGGP